ncbi:zf-TFIIB domain-containing protein [Photobacterium sp. CCB-ST2H9]|uniref:zf-TFIIB domain-containing protein n=1 Tax=Photobacterium sp. CCB-ST2H9 TaxID=2912855 RepID=UPI0020037E7F|nr:zf-TFIIB domain-containing protein [Photobacterium sp. CCB-ST2H9]UTM59808.1 zf-TFIIB domain-containing protein [Photobacterium sp. CCB-ST2H9]
MQCPKCHSNFEHVTTPLGDIERCTACKGLWLDAYEIEKMKPLADTVDIGDANIGKSFNKIDQIQCPVCPNNELLRLVDPKQPHIWFESCPTCKGRFYDAGEFKDLAKIDLSDFFKKLFTEERR